MQYIPALRSTSLKVQNHKKYHFFQPFFPESLQIAQIA